MSVLDLLGLGRKGKRLVSGHAACLEKLQVGAGALVLTASDASEGTRERFRRLAVQRGIPCREVGSREELGLAMGTAPRAVVVVLDPELAAGMRARIDRGDSGE